MSAEQGTPEWLIERAGHCTASRFSDVLAKIKVGEAADRRNYRMQLVTERLTGLPVEGYTNAAMAWGTEHQEEAREAYEASTGLWLDKVGFVKHPEIEWCGASPDGLVGPDGGLEIKCPFVSTVHVQTLLNGAMPSEHVAQVQGNMWVNGRAWWDFVSFDPRMPERLQLVVYRVVRDEAYIARLESEVKQFLLEVDNLLKQLQQS